MQDKKQSSFKTPDLSKLQEVVMDDRTTIYIAVGADPEEARSRYRTRSEARSKMYVSKRKPV
jgi:hypothetical protein